MRHLSAALRALAIALPVAAARTAAAGETTATRVDFLDSPAVIGLGHWQFDPVFPLLPGPQEHVVSKFTSHFTSPVVSVNPSQAMQLRAAGSYAADELPLETANDRLRRLHGFSDVSLGAQWRVRGGDAGWLPGVAWLADVESTTGMPDFRGPVFRPSLRATAQWALQPDLSLGLMPGIYRDRDEVGKHYAAGVLALTLGKAWTPRLHTFFEVAGERLTQSQHGGSSVTLDTGIAFRATRSLRFEAIVSHGLAGDSRNAQGGVGVSSRF